MVEPGNTVVDITKPRAAIIGSGGTISSTGRHSLDLFDYGAFEQLLPIDEVVARIQEVEMVCDVVPFAFRSLPSSAVGLREWLDLLALIHLKRSVVSMR